MKTIKVLKAVEYRALGSDSVETLEMKRWLLDAIDSHAPFGQGSGNVLRGCRLYETIETADGEVRLEDADFAALSAAVEACSYHPWIARAAKPFYEEIDRASKATP